jgi:hypothetical protein
MEMLEILPNHIYGAQLLLIATVACAQASLAFLFKNITTHTYTPQASQGLMIIIIGWAIASIFALAF